MSILNQNNIQPELTLDQKKERAASRALSLAAQTYNQLLFIQKQGIDIVWDNPSGLTSQEVCDGLGDKAVKLFEFHGALTEFIAGLASVEGIQPDIKLPTKNFTKNVDGTVTVLESDYGT